MTLPPEFDPNVIERGGTPPPPPPQPTSVRIDVPFRSKYGTITFVILGVSIAIFVFQFISNQLFRVDYPLALGAKINEGIRAGQFWRLLTPALLHASLLHIGFNMYALFSIGRGLEKFYGHGRYFLLYLVAALGGNTLSFLLSPNPSVGASTAIFGLVAAEAAFIYKNRFLFGERSRRMLSNIATIIVVNLILGLTPGIDNWGHLGGLIAGGAFAWFAGPAFKVVGAYPGLKIEDTHTSRHTLASASLATLICCVLVWLGM